VKEVVMETAADTEFSEFMQGRWTQLVRLGYGLTGDRQLAEDLAQTALARAYASWPRVRRSGNPDAYVRRIMVNANHSRFRKHRVAERLTDTVPEAGTADLSAAASEDRSALMAALLALPHGQRAVVVLRYWMDMTETETAATLGCSVGNVKSQASRALAKLRLGSGLLDPTVTLDRRRTEEMSHEQR
jgi:RNA polymerase sigma-70 factor (sigma-E family)